MENEKNTRAEQSRINGAKSRGPKTPEGKARSSQNARKLGLYAKRDVTLTTEQQADLDALRAEYYAEWRPVDQRQQDLVDMLVDAQWNHLRYASMEKWLVDNQISKMRNEIPLMYGTREPAYDLRAVLAYDRLYKEGPTLEKLQRERRACVRTIARLNAELRLLQAENPPVDEPEEVTPDQEPEQCEKCEIEPKPRPRLMPPPFPWKDMDSPRIDPTRNGPYVGS